MLKPLPFATRAVINNTVEVKQGTGYCARSRTDFHVKTSTYEKLMTSVTYTYILIHVFCPCVFPPLV